MDLDKLAEVAHKRVFKRCESGECRDEDVFRTRRRLFSVWCVLVSSFRVIHDLQYLAFFMWWILMYVFAYICIFHVHICVLLYVFIYKHAHARVC